MLNSKFKVYTSLLVRSKQQLNRIQEIPTQLEFIWKLGLYKVRQPGRAPKRAAWGKSWSEKIAHSTTELQQSREIAVRNHLFSTLNGQAFKNGIRLNGNQHSTPGQANHFSILEMAFFLYCLSFSVFCLRLAKGNAVQGLEF